MRAPCKTLRSNNWSSRPKHLTKWVPKMIGLAWGLVLRNLAAETETPSGNVIKPLTASWIIALKTNSESMNIDTKRARTSRTSRSNRERNSHRTLRRDAPQDSTTLSNPERRRTQTAWTYSSTTSVWKRRKCLNSRKLNLRNRRTGMRKRSRNGLQLRKA